MPFRLRACGKTTDGEGVDATASARPTRLGALAGVVKAAKWKRFVDIRSTFASVDRATAGSGRPVFVFNIAGNRFRLISSIHFNQQRIFTLRFLTHAEYDNENWKREL